MTKQDSLYKFLQNNCPDLISEIAAGTYEGILHGEARHQLMHLEEYSDNVLGQETFEQGYAEKAEDAYDNGFCAGHVKGFTEGVDKGKKEATNE